MKRLPTARLLFCCVVSAVPVQLAASTISGTVNCGGTFQSTSTLGSVACGSLSLGPYASVSIGSRRVAVTASRLYLSPYTQAYASGRFSDELILTITGGTGAGLFTPVIIASSGGSSGSGASAGGFFGTVGCSSDLNSSCGTFGQQPIPFTFDVPQTLRFGLSASTGGGLGDGGAQVSLSDIWVVSAPGVRINNPAFAYTLVGTSQSIPEPGTSCPVALTIAVTYFAAVCRKRRQ